MSYIGSIQSLVTKIGPWFLHSRNIARFLEATALSIDAAVTSLDQGLRLSQPLRCHPSALPVLSGDRGIRLYPSEAESSKRERLANWLQLHRARATHAGQLKHTQPYFSPAKPVIRIVHQDGAGATATWWTIGADGEIAWHAQSPSNWNYDGQTSKWSRYWVILYPPAGFFPPIPVYGDGTLWDNGAYYDGISNLQVVRDLIEMIIEWRAPHSRLAAYIIANDPASFDPTSTAVTGSTGWTTMPVGNWGSAITPPPTAIRPRLPTALWLYER